MATMTKLSGVRELLLCIKTLGFFEGVKIFLHGGMKDDLPVWEADYLSVGEAGKVFKSSYHEARLERHVRSKRKLLVSLAVASVLCLLALFVSLPLSIVSFIFAILVVLPFGVRYRNTSRAVAESAIDVEDARDDLLAAREEVSRLLTLRTVPVSASLEFPWWYFGGHVDPLVQEFYAEKDKLEFYETGTLSGHEVFNQLTRWRELLESIFTIDSKLKTAELYENVLSGEFRRYSKMLESLDLYDSGDIEGAARTAGVPRARARIESKIENFFSEA